MIAVRPARDRHIIKSHIPGDLSVIKCQSRQALKLGMLCVATFKKNFMPTAFDRRLQDRQPTQAGGQSKCADNCFTRRSRITPCPPAWSI